MFHRNDNDKPLRSNGHPEDGFRWEDCYADPHGTNHGIVHDEIYGEEIAVHTHDDEGACPFEQNEED